MLMYNKRKIVSDDFTISEELIESRRRQLAEFLYLRYEDLLPSNGELDVIGEMLLMAEEQRLGVQDKVKEDKK